MSCITRPGSVLCRLSELDIVERATQIGRGKAISLLLLTTPKPQVSVPTFPTPLFPLLPFIDHIPTSTRLIRHQHSPPPTPAPRKQLHSSSSTMDDQEGSPSSSSKRTQVDDDDRDCKLVKTNDDAQTQQQKPPALDTEAIKQELVSGCGQLGATVIPTSASHRSSSCPHRPATSASTLPLGLQVSVARWTTTHDPGTSPTDISPPHPPLLLCARQPSSHVFTTSAGPASKNGTHSAGTNAHAARPSLPKPKSMLLSSTSAT